MLKVTFQFSLEVIIDHSPDYKIYKSETENASSDPGMG